jgi:MFS family permease
MLTLASLILLGGTAGDRYGRRRVFLVGLLAFATASLLCGLAPAAEFLLIARLAQGAAAAALTTGKLAIIGAAYPGKDRGPRSAHGLLPRPSPQPLVHCLAAGWSMLSAGARSSSSIFRSQPSRLPWALRLPADRGEGASRLDVVGAALATAGLGLLSFGLISLGEGDRAYGALAIAAAVPVGVLFIWAEARVKEPMMPLDLFRNRNFAGAIF